MKTADIVVGNEYIVTNSLGRHRRYMRARVLAVGVERPLTTGWKRTAHDGIEIELVPLPDVAPFTTYRWITDSDGSTRVVRGQHLQEPWTDRTEAQYINGALIATDREWTAKARDAHAEVVAERLRSFGISAFRDSYGQVKVEAAGLGELLDRLEGTDHAR